MEITLNQSTTKAATTLAGQIPYMVPPATRTWAGREYPVTRWEEGFSEHLKIGVWVRLAERRGWTLPNVYVGVQRFNLSEYDPHFLEWLEEAGVPMETAEEYAVYLGDQGLTPDLQCRELELNSDGSLFIGGPFDED